MSERSTSSAKERFIVDGQLIWMFWEEAEALPQNVRIKTSAALWRARARAGMELTVRLEPGWAELSALLPCPL